MRLILLESARDCIKLAIENRCYILGRVNDHILRGDHHNQLLGDSINDDPSKAVHANKHPCFPVLIDSLRLFALLVPRVVAAPVAELDVHNGRARVVIFDGFHRLLGFGGVKKDDLATLIAQDHIFAAQQVDVDGCDGVAQEFLRLIREGVVLILVVAVKHPHLAL